LGGRPAKIQFAGDTCAEVACLQALGDSMIWTGMYVGSQALRHPSTNPGGTRTQRPPLDRHVRAERSTLRRHMPYGWGQDAGMPSTWNPDLHAPCPLAGEGVRRPGSW